MRSRAACALVACAALLWSGAVLRDGVDAWVAETALPALVPETGTEVRARDGSLLRAYTVETGRWRLAVDPAAVDPLLRRALIAYEDRRFAQHAGVDPRAMLRAVGQALWAGRVVSGGSTLTMQVARLLEDGPTGQWRGKLRQIRLALALERVLTKDQILSLYLHLAPYGGNIEGISAASRIWLGKPPARLTPAEVAFLVALPQAPEARRPDRHPQAARAARDRVLHRLAEAGVLSDEAAQAAQTDPLPLTRRAMPQLAPLLADRARGQSGGAGRIDTTLKADLQAAVQGLAARLDATLDPSVSVAVLVADPHSGAVLASVGAGAYGAAQGQGFVDMTQAQRSPGSLLKPLVYALAFDRGLAHPETLIADTPVDFAGYAPQNFDRQFRGDVTVREALHLSLNIPVVRLTEALGPAHLVAGLTRAGTAPAYAGEPGLALSLGGLGLSLSEVVQLYAGLARGGEAVTLHWTGAGTPTPERIVSAASAWQVGQILSQIPPPPASGRVGQVAYKTGTSYGHRDAWAVGWDGQHVAGVWIGRPDGTPVPGAFGGTLAAPLLFQTLAQARRGGAALPPPPAEVLMLGNADLPPALQRFGGGEVAPAIDLLFPPEGARLMRGAGVPVKLRGGQPPYTLLVDGAVALTGQQRPEFTAPLTAPGFATLSVIDAAGQGARVGIELR